MNPELKKAGFSGWFDRNPPDNKGIHALTSGVFLDGRSQLLVGTASTVEAVNEQGKLRASMNPGVGVVTDIALLDCGGEVRLFPARLFGNSQLQHTSSQSPDKSSRMFVGPFTPRQGASTHVANTGNGYFAVETADLDGDGKKELAVITARRFAILLNHRCEKLWARPLPSDPTAVVTLAAEAGQPGRLVVSCRDGDMYVLDAAGKFLAQGKADGIPTKMERLSSTEVVISTAEGAALAYRVR